MNRLSREIADCKATIVRGMIPSISKLHRACEIALEQSCEYYSFNKTYNQYVTNGEHLPENLGEEISYRIGLVDMPENIKQAYLKACWINDCFFYPPKENVAAMMFRL